MSFINPKKFKFDSNRKYRNVRSIVTNRIIQNYHLFASCESCSILFAIRSILSLIFDRIGKFIVIRIKNRDIFFFFFLFIIREMEIPGRHGFLDQVVYNRERIECLSVSPLALAFHLVLRSRFSFESRLGISIPLFFSVPFLRRLQMKRE